MVFINNQNYINDKTTALLFTNKYRIKYPDLLIDKNIIPFVSSFNFLGFTFDSRLTWNIHIKNLVIRCQKINNILRSMTGFKWGASKTILLTVYKGLIRSILDYGSVLFLNASKHILTKLDSIQYKSLSICLGSFKGSILLFLRCNLSETNYLYL